MRLHVVPWRCCARVVDKFSPLMLARVFMWRNVQVRNGRFLLNEVGNQASLNSTGVRDCSHRVVNSVVTLNGSSLTQVTVSCLTRYRERLWFMIACYFILQLLILQNIPIWFSWWMIAWRLVLCVYILVNRSIRQISIWVRIQIDSFLHIWVLPRRRFTVF